MRLKRSCWCECHRARDSEHAIPCLVCLALRKKTSPFSLRCLPAVCINTAVHATQHPQAGLKEFPESAYLNIIYGGFLIDISGKVTARMSPPEQPLPLRTAQPTVRKCTRLFHSGRRQG